jgi:hypothetical protein
MTPEDDRIMAYVDGELDEAGVREVEQAMENDPAVAEAVARHRALATGLSAAFDPALTETVPERLRAAAAGPARPAELVELAQVRERKQAAEAAAAARTSAAPRWTWRHWTAAAVLAGLAVMVATPLLKLGSGPSAPVQAQGEVLLAGGPLAQALDRQLAADQGKAVRIGLTFKAQDGAWCRTFATQTLAGLACREGKAWRLRATADPAPETGGGMRTAGSAIPPAVLAAVDAAGGEPVDAADEARARDARWR